MSEDLALVRTLAQKAAYGDGLTPEVRMVLAESCLGRVVRLIGFFYPLSGIDTALTAERFVRDRDAWERARPAMPAVFRTHILDMIRLVDADPWMLPDCKRAFGCWPFSSFASELERLMALLESHMASDVASWFRNGRQRSATIN